MSDDTLTQGTNGTVAALAGDVSMPSAVAIAEAITASAAGTPLGAAAGAPARIVEKHAMARCSAASSAGRSSP
jgi:hypothetical protein